MSIQIVLAVVGTTGLLGSIVAFFRLRPDANTAAVTQSQGAVETMALLQRELERDRDNWRARALECESTIGQRDTEIRRLQALLERRRAERRK